MTSLIDINSELDSLNACNSYRCDPESCSTMLGTSQNNALTILQLNIRSINKNFDQFRILLLEMKISCDVLVLTECWLQNHVNLPLLDGYISYSTSNHSNQNAGVAIYVKSSLTHTISEPHLKYADSLICIIDNKIAIVAIYRSPSYSLQDQFEIFLETLNNALTNLNSYNNIALLGDLNIDIKPLNEDKFSDEYLTLNASHALSPTHVFPTRLNKCIDHILLKSKFTATTLVIESHITDHLPTLLCLQLKHNKNLDNKLRSTIDIASIQLEIADTDLSHILLIDDANSATDSLISILSSVVTKHTILIPVPRKQRILKPWITPGLLRCIRNRDRLHKDSKNAPNNQIIKTTYIRYRNFCNLLLRKLKVTHEKNVLLKSKNDVKATWKAIKKITNTEKPRNPPLELLKLTENTGTSLDSVNNYFVEIGKNLASNLTSNSIANASITPYLPKTYNPNSMVILETDEIEIESIIMGLRSDSATGWDGLSPSILKSIRNFIIPSITHIANTAFRTGVFPNACKKALVHPIYKNGNRSIISNYRPISVLSTISKILEKLLNRRLINYLNKNNIVSAQQYGFRPGISTEDAVVDLASHITSALDQGLKCTGVFLDLQKAFDTVHIPALLSKLDSVGVRGIALNIFRDYLRNRSQRVVINGLQSGEASIEYGVPQGSILGPTLFQIYINQLCDLNLPNCKIFTYADDTALVFQGSSWADVKSTAEDNLAIVSNWLTQNLLTLNISKSFYIPFSIKNNTQPPTNYEIRVHANCNNTGNCSCLSISQTKIIKYLGVYFDRNLNWYPQVDMLATRIRRLIHIFRTLRQSADTETLNTVYSALCTSVLTYCVPAWGGAAKTHFLKVERAQRAVLKVLHHKIFRFPTKDLYKLAKVLTVRQLFIIRSILRRHEQVRQPDPTKRNHYRICPPIPHKTKFSSRQFQITSSFLYNKINKVLNIIRLSRFEIKKKVSQWLQKLNYDDTEYLLT